MRDSNARPSESGVADYQLNNAYFQGFWAFLTRLMTSRMIIPPYSRFYTLSKCLKSAS